MNHKKELERKILNLLRTEYGDDGILVDEAISALAGAIQWLANVEDEDDEEEEENEEIVDINNDDIIDVPIINIKADDDDYLF